MTRDVFELLVELTIIRFTFLESSLYLVNQIRAIHLELRSLTEYQGSFTAPCLLSRCLPIVCHSIFSVSPAARNGDDIGT